MSELPKVFVFGPFELDIAAGRVIRDGVPLHVPPQPFRLLELLVTRAGQLVSRDDIAAHLWHGDTFVDFSAGLNFCVKQLREVLGDQAGAPTYIETVPRRGYRFIAPVQTVASEVSASLPVETEMAVTDVVPVAVLETHTSSSAWWRRAAMACALFLTMISGADIAAPRESRAVMTREQVDSAELVERSVTRIAEADLEQLRERISWLERAAETDPHSAPAFAALAGALTELGRQRGAPPAFVYARARALARHALTLDPRQPEALAVLGRVAIVLDWNTADADRYFNAAVAHSGAPARVHQWRSWYLSASARHTEAIDEARRALDRDPQSLAFGATLGNAHLYAGQHAAARRVCAAGVDASPGREDLRNCLLGAEIGLGQTARGIDAYAAALRLTGRSGLAEQITDHFNRGGIAEVCRWQASEIQRHFSGPRLSDEAMKIAGYMACANDRAGALTWLRRAADEHLDAFVWIRTAPMLQTLHDDSEFRSLARRIDPRLFVS